MEIVIGSLGSFTSHWVGGITSTGKNAPTAVAVCARPFYQGFRGKGFGDHGEDYTEESVITMDLFGVSVATDVACSAQAINIKSSTSTRMGVGFMVNSFW